MNTTKQGEKILAYLKRNEGLTTIDAYMKLNILSPAKRISELRAAGHNIETVWKTSRDGARYGVYILNEQEADYDNI